MSTPVDNRVDNVCTTRGSLGDDGVPARVPVAIVHHQLREPLDVERVLGDDAAVRRPGHRGQQRGEAGIPSEDFDDEKALVRPRGSPQAVRELDRTGHAGAEPDAVVGTGDVVVHRLGDGHEGQGGAREGQPPAHHLQELVGGARRRPGDPLGCQGARRRGLSRAMIVTARGLGAGTISGSFSIRPR